MTAVIQYATYPLEELLVLLDTWAEQLPFAYLEAEVEITLAYTSDVINQAVQTRSRFDRPQAVAIAFDEWLHGRAFGEMGELRWTRQPDNRYQIMWLTEGEQRLLEGHLTHFDGYEERNVLLIGKLRANRYWTSARYPHPAEYPVDPSPGRAYLTCVDYKKNHMTVITRMKGFL